MSKEKLPRATVQIGDTKIDLERYERIIAAGRYNNITNKIRELAAKLGESRAIIARVWRHNDRREKELAKINSQKP